MSNGSTPFRLEDSIYLTDGGMETTLTFLNGVDLPYFASFPLLDTPVGRRQLEHYFEPYLKTAAQHEVGFVLDTPTWRASADWGEKLGYTPEALADLNRRAVGWVRDMGKELSGGRIPLVVNGIVGPRGDGYRPDAQMSTDESQDYHSAQIAAFKEAGADMVSAMTMNSVEEAVGIARAAQKIGIPAMISFTVETDGKLPGGTTLKAAIEAVDAATDSAPLSYMINCAHPTHLNDALSEGGDWTNRVRGLRANASAKSHAELDESTELDSGNPAELGRHYREISKRLTRLQVLGGCCGTDHRHIVAICEACLPKAGALHPY